MKKHRFKVSLVSSGILMCIITYSQYSLEEVSLPFTGHFKEIIFNRDNIGFITGIDESAEGFILRTSNNGDSWQPAEIKNTNTIPHVGCIDFISSMKGYASAFSNDSAFILKTNDQGVRWDPVYMGISHEIIYMDYFSEDLGYFIGKTKDQFENDIFEILKISGAENTIDTLELTYNGSSIQGNAQKLTVLNRNTFIVVYKQLFGGSDLYHVVNDSDVTRITPSQPVNEVFDLFYSGMGSVLISTGNGNDATIYGTDNDGENWNDLFFHCCTTKINALDVVNDKGIGVGQEVDIAGNRFGLISVSVNAGIDWNNTAFEEDIELLDVALSKNGNIFFIGDTTGFLMSSTHTSIYKLSVSPFSNIGNEKILVNNGILIYPNPIGNYARLIIEIEDYKDLSYQLFDMKGKLLHAQKITGWETLIDLSGLTPSIYFMKVMSKNQSVKEFKITKN